MNIVKQLVENLKARVPKLKDEAEEVGEDVAVQVWEAVSETCMQYAQDPATNAIVKAVLPAAVGLVDHIVREAIDKIDGHVG